VSDVTYELSRKGSSEADKKIDSNCTKNWTAAKPDNEKMMWEKYDETGIFAAVCRHGQVLVMCDMIRSGEL
jgi:hypothetical protein